MSIYRDPLASMTGPRSLVRRPEAPGIIRWVPRVFIVPHVLAGVGLLLVSLTMIATSLVGTDATGRVIGERVTMGSKKSGNTYVVEYTYPTPQGEALGTESVSIGASTQPPGDLRKEVGQSIPVRYLGVGSARHSIASRGGAPGGVAMLAFAAVWNSFLGVFVWMLWIQPLRQRWLYRHGVVAPGTITGKRIKKGKSTTHEVDYSFEMPGGTVKQGSMQLVPKALWESVQVGGRVAVLHPRDRAEPNLVYECGGLAWADPSQAR